MTFWEVAALLALYIILNKIKGIRIDMDDGGMPNSLSGEERHTQVKRPKKKPKGQLRN
jgi:hypothetical protein